MIIYVNLETSAKDQKGLEYITRFTYAHCHLESKSLAFRPNAVWLTRFTNAHDFIVL